MKLNNTIKLIICNNRYENDNAISQTIEYIYRLKEQKNLPIFCYGIYPPTYKNIISNFEYVRTLNDRDVSNGKVFHLILSFAQKEDDMTCYHFADRIARLFSQEYQICYACHKDTDNLHFHYIISATSYLSNYPALSEKSLQNYLQQAKQTALTYNYILDLEVKNNV